MERGTVAETRKTVPFLWLRSRFDVGRKLSGGGARWTERRRSYVQSPLVHVVALSFGAVGEMLEIEIAQTWVVCR